MEKYGSGLSREEGGEVRFRIECREEGEEVRIRMEKLGSG